MLFTREEVAEHRYEDDCWMVVAGKAYDVTSVLSTHPGGPECIMDCAGVDGTAAFEDVGHSANAWEALKDCYVGDMKDMSCMQRPRGRRLQKRASILDFVYPLLAVAGLLMYVVIQSYKWGWGKHAVEV